MLNSLKKRPDLKRLLDTELIAAREVRTLGGYQILRLTPLLMQSTHPAWCIFTLRRVLAMKSGLFCEHQLDASTSAKEVRPHEMIVAKAFPYICHKDRISWLALLLTPPTGIAHMGERPKGG